MIGGIVGGALGACALLGIALCVWRRKRKQRERENLEYENEVRGEFGRRLELEFDDDEPGRGGSVSMRPCL